MVVVSDGEALERIGNCGEDDEFWRFPPLDHRVWQQFSTTDRDTGLKTVSRTCTRCGQFTLVRYDPGNPRFSAAEKRFVDQNRTRCEPD